MTKEKKEFKPKLRYYHIIFLSFLLCPLLMLNSKLVNEKRNQEKALRGTTEISEYYFGRNLGFKEDTDQICERGSEDLRDYYTTRDLSKLGIKEDSSAKERPAHINALITMISEGTSGGEGLEDNAMTYVKHLIPVFFFLAVAVLAIPGWIVCCSCCCCNCCCCCCCKNPCCKLPFYIVTNVMYAIVVVISIYGLSQSNSIFVGLADTECSLLRFIGEILDGETKTTTPKWGGIEQIKNLLQDTVTEIENIDNSALTTLDNTKSSLIQKETAFEGQLKTSSQSIHSDSAEGHYNYGSYRLDIARDFGVFDGTNAPPITTFVGVWYNEYKTISEQTTENMGEVRNNFNTVKDPEMTNSLTEASTQFEDIKKSIDDVKNEVSDAIINNSETIEDYGKLGFKIVFSVLTVIDVAIAALMFLFCFCSGKPCSSCCFFRCGLKLVLHILWNIMALLMILTFLIGSIFTLVGTIGKDLTSAVSYIVGEENLGKGEEAMLLGDAAEKLNICINKDGNINKEIKLNDNTDSLQTLKDLENQILTLEQQSVVLKDQKIAYNNFTRILGERASYSDINYNLIDNSGNKLNLKDKLAALNSATEDIKDKWEFSQNTQTTCPTYSSHTDFLYFNPYNCIPSQRYTSCESVCSSFSTISNDVSGIVKAQNYANGGDSTSIKKVITELNGLYDTFLQTQIDGLGAFRSTIHRLTGIFENFVGTGDGFFSFLNCKFIGTNIKVLLKTLENSLGKDFYTVGVCLLLSGFSMAVGISFTILLMVIINSTVGKQS